MGSGWNNSLQKNLAGTRSDQSVCAASSRYPLAVQYFADFFAALHVLLCLASVRLLPGRPFVGPPVDMTDRIAM